MDWKESLSTLASSANRARRWSANHTARALDSLAPLAAPLAARWDAEADRRRQLRTPDHLKALMDAQRVHNQARLLAQRARRERSMARKTSRNPLAAARRAARTADKAASAAQEQAKGTLKEARKEYPLTLPQLAVRAHAAHAVPASLASYLLSTPQDWAVWPASVSAGLITVNAFGLWLGRRGVAPVVAEDVSAEERALLERLDPAYWVAHADDRGLGGTVTGTPTITQAGIECAIRLDGKWDVSKFAAAESHVRALLGARTGLPVLIKEGPSGGWGLMVWRTRSATDGQDLTWAPGLSWGVDDTTGEPVEIPLGERLLIAGRSGAGKSVATRPLLYAASEGPTDRLVIIDLKWIEARQWDHRARVATSPEQAAEVAAELAEEMTERLSQVPKGKETVEVTEARPRITVFVDEGAEVLVNAKDAVSDLESIARLGRAAEIHLVWATQKPSMSGSSAGIPPQIAGQMSASVCLAVRTPSDARVVLGEDATEKGWDAHELPSPGVALLRDGKRKPDPIRTRQTFPAQAAALPERPIWQREAGAPAATGRPALRLVKDGPDFELAPPAPEVPASREESAGGPVTNRDRVLAAIRDGARTVKDVTDRTGLNKGTVSREVKQLVEAGAVRRADDGALSAGEVSA